MEGHVCDPNIAKSWVSRVRLFSVKIRVWFRADPRIQALAYDQKTTCQQEKDLRLGVSFTCLIHDLFFQKGKRTQNSESVHGCKQSPQCPCNELSLTSKQGTQGLLEPLAVKLQRRRCPQVSKSVQLVVRWCFNKRHQEGARFFSPKIVTLRHPHFACGTSVSFLWQIKDQHWSWKYTSGYSFATPAVPNLQQCKELQISATNL